MMTRNKFLASSIGLLVGPLLALDKLKAKPQREIILPANVENATGWWITCYEDNVQETLDSVFDSSFTSVATKMPCGHQFEVYGPKDLPLVDTPCPCGDPKHWLVRWDVLKEGIKYEGA